MLTIPTGTAQIASWRAIPPDPARNVTQGTKNAPNPLSAKPLCGRIFLNSGPGSTIITPMPRRRQTFGGNRMNTPKATDALASFTLHAVASFSFSNGGNEMKHTSNHAQVAKLIRAELKKNGIKATVRSKSYSGGSSVTVNVQQDVMPATLKEIEAFCGQFEQGHFDGMTDCYEYSNRRTDIPQIKFVFVNVSYSDEIKQAARDYINEISGIDEWERDRYSWMALNGSWGNFWSARKPRVRAA